MAQPVQSEVVPVPSQEESDRDRIRAAEVVIAYLKNSQLPSRSRPYEVLRELAERTKELLSRGQSADLTTSNLKAGVAPDVGKEPSAWLSPHWNYLVDAEPGWQEGMAGEARRLGIGVVPKLEKIPGTPAYYRLLAAPLPEEAAVVEVAPVPEGGIHYTAEAVTAPGGWLFKKLGSGEVSWTGPVRWTIAISLMLCLIALLVVGWLLLNGAVRIWRPVSPADLAVLMTFGALVAGLVSLFRVLGELFEMKVILAPTLLTPLTKDNVTLEHRPSTGEASGQLVFVRYTATCPVCQGRVELFDGQRAFPDRLVGRCNRSGREHVFSFDHVRRVGHPLR